MRTSTDESVHNPILDLEGHGVERQRSLAQPSEHRFGTIKIEDRVALDLTEYAPQTSVRRLSRVVMKPLRDSTAGND